MSLGKRFWLIRKAKDVKYSGVVKWRGINGMNKNTLKAILVFTFFIYILICLLFLFDYTEDYPQFLLKMLCGTFFYLVMAGITIVKYRTMYGEKAVKDFFKSDKK